MDPFETALALTFSPDVEGGLSDISDNHGGHTYRGVTQGIYTAWRINKGLPPRPVEEAPQDELKECAYENVWIPARCGSFAIPVSVIHFDFAFNSGPRHAITLMQAVLGIKTDGVIGDVTLMEANRRVPKLLAHDLVTARRGYHLKAAIDEATQWKFVAGWLARCHTLDVFIANSGSVG